MDPQWIYGRTDKDANGDYAFPASRELITGICVIAYFVEAETGGLLTGLRHVSFSNETFSLLAYHYDRRWPDFAFGTSPATVAFDVSTTWDAEGRPTTVSREVSTEEVVAAVGSCLRSLSTNVDEVNMSYLEVFGDNYAGDKFVERLLKAGRKAAA